MEALGKELICMMFQFLSTPGILFCTGFVFVQFGKRLLSVCWLGAVENTEMGEKYILLH